ncbi:MAG: hypothetical protein Q9168_005672, partial [Polycauliona sp. 1 TL-2023]
MFLTSSIELTSGQNEEIEEDEKKWLGRISEPPDMKAIIRGMLASIPGLAAKWPAEKGSPPSPLWPPLPDRNHDTQGPAIIVSSVFVMVFATLITGFRVGARWSGKHNRIGWDDYFIIAATTSLNIAQVTTASLGKRNYNFTYADTERAKNLGFFFSFFLPWVQGFTKLSIVCFNARLTGLTARAWRWTHRFLFACSLIFVVFWTIFIVLLVQPVSSAFSYINNGRKPGHLLPGVSGTSVTLAFLLHHVLLDWILLAIPVYVILRLQMPLVKKLRCIVPLLTGLLSCIGASYGSKYALHQTPRDNS